MAFCSSCKPKSTSPTFADGSPPRTLSQWFFSSFGQDTKIKIPKMHFSRTIEDWMLKFKKNRQILHFFTKQINPHHSDQGESKEPNNPLGKDSLATTLMRHDLNDLGLNCSVKKCKSVSWFKNPILDFSKEIPPHPRLLKVNL